MDSELFRQTAQGILNEAPSALSQNWDAGIIAIAHAPYNLDQSIIELRSLFDIQLENGRIPQMLSAGDGQAPEDTGLVVLPIFGAALLQLYELAADKAAAKAFLQEMYPKVLQLHRYLYDFRDPEEEGLVCIYHPLESGLVYNPAWEKVLSNISILADEGNLKASSNFSFDDLTAQGLTASDRERYQYLLNLIRQHDFDEKNIFDSTPFLIQDPLFNGVLSWSNEALIQIGSLIGSDISEPLQWHELTVWSMNEKLWDEDRGIYNAFDLKHNEMLREYSISGLLPMCGEVPTQEQAEELLLHLESSAFGGKNPAVRLCPSYTIEGKTEPNRGPVSIKLNWLLYHGLMRYDMEQMAEKIRKHSLECLVQSGCYPWFASDASKDAIKGLGDPRTPTSAAVGLSFLLS